MPAKRSRLASPDEQRENNFLPKNGELCYDCDVVGRSCRRGAGATTRWSWGIAERGVERIDSIRPVYPGVPARTGNRDGGEFSATVDPALRAAGQATYARARLAHAGPGQRWAGDRPNGSRLEMVPQVFGRARFAPGNGAPPGRRPACRRPAVFNRRWTS